jgi:hypothetical protein
MSFKIKNPVIRNKIKDFVDLASWDRNGVGKINP